MATPVPLHSNSDLEYDQILQVFNHLENGPPPEIQNIQEAVTVFKDMCAVEKRSKLLETLVGGTPDPVLALALACDESFRYAFEADLEHAFPTTPAQFTNSLAQRAIKKLDSIYAALPTSNFTRSFHEHRCAVLHVASVFEALKGTNFDYPISPVTKDSETQIFGSKKMTQKQTKRARARGPSIDETPLQKMGVSRPRSQSECNQLIKNLLAGQKEILQNFIRNTAHDEMQDYFLSSILTNIQANTTTKSNQEVDSIASAADVLSPPTADSTASQYLGTLGVVKYLDDSVEGFGEWKILLSSRCEQHLRQFSRRDAKRFEIIKKKITELSRGFFSASNQKKLLGQDTDLPVFEAKMERDTRLVYTVDCVMDDSGENETQVLKLFGVFSHAEIDRNLWQAVGHHLQRRGPDHRKRCMARQTSRNHNGYVIPQSFPPLPEVYEEPVTPTNLDHAQILQLHSLLALEKFIPLTQAVLNNILADEDATHPFSVSNREQEIIFHSSSCFVLGRSGTGKTTTMLFKMLGVERSSVSLFRKKIRQVFVTQSRVLAERVQEYYTKLARSSAAGECSEGEIKKRATQRSQAEKELIELDDEDDSQSGLPKKFSELTDGHFPLFLTFDKLCQLLEADFGLKFKRKSRTAEEKRALRRFELREVKDVPLDLENEDIQELRQHTEQKRVEEELKIDYHVFRSLYWPHFPQNLTKGLDPALVWSEFLGVISGSEGSLEAEYGYIDRNSYEGLSHRTQATFAKQRGPVYSLFQAYIRRKRELEGYDVADRTHALLQAIQANGLPGCPIDFLYCDESQDNLLIDVKLMHTLCHNPHGFFWAGDTAQQITSTAFRFADLKAFLFRIEKSNDLVKRGVREAIHPKSFSLSVNYRSHGGIVNCARTVVETITHFWPDSIDVLEDERGLVDGPKPIFFRGWKDGVVHYEQFLFGEAGSRVEFGAEQCILVRDERARDELRAMIGDIGLIMTLYEAKGLEFSDVLLYDFFNDSPTLTADWRVILNKVDLIDRDGTAAPRFDELRHTSVCSELKFLYVGLTRARNQLWIWDSSDRGEPMRALWSTRNQIDIRKPGDPIPKLAVSSTPEEWAKTGRLLFSNGRYRQAKLCFDHAGLPLERDISHGYHLRQDARLLERGSKQRETAFLFAADAFLVCGSKARDIQKTRCFNRAAECYVEAKHLSQASDAYYQAEEWTMAARYARLAGKFDRAVEIIREERGVEPSVANSIIHVCKVVYVQTKEIEKARPLFESDEDFLELMDEYGFEKAPILETLGRYIEAGHLRAAAGETVAAIRLFAQGGDHDRAAQCLCDAFWEHLPYNTSVTDDNRKQIRTLEKVLPDIVEPSIHWKNELSMFHAIIKCDTRTLEALALTFANDNSGRSNSALLRCLDYLSRQQQDVYDMNFEEVNHLLRILRLFGITYRKITRLPELETSNAIQRALGFRLDESGLEATISTSSFLARAESVSPLVMRRNDRNEIVVNSRQLGVQIATLLDGHLVSVLSNHAVACSGAKSFQDLCSTYLDERQLECQCHRLHVKRGDVPAIYNQQLQLHLRQILVLSQGEPYDWKERRNQRNRRLRRIFEILFPLHDAAGNLASFTSREPGVSEGLTVLRGWLQDSICDLDVKNPSAMLKTLLMASALDIKRRPNGRKFSILHRVPHTVEGYRVDVDGKQQPLFLDLINALFRPVRGSVEQGIAFLQHVIKERVRIDLHALVIFLEIFTAIFVGCLHQGRMDQAVLPRSFLFYLSQRPRLPTANVWSISHLLRPLEDLVEAIYSGQNEFTDLKFPYRGRIISRIFRCLVIIGCNSGSTVFQSQVGRSISALRKDREDIPFWVLYFGYLKAQDWHELAISAYESLNDCAVDQIVRTVQLAQGQNPLDPSDGLTVLPFTDERSLFAPYISSPLVSDIRKSKLRATAKTLVSKPSALYSTVTRAPSSALNEQGLKNRGMAEPTAPISVEDLDAPPTPGETKAATVIQMAYRRALGRREAPPPKDRRVKQWYDQCVGAQIYLQGPKIYSKYFLGPLVHALIWADTMVRLLKHRKDLIKKKFGPTQIEHTQIEDFMTRLAVCNENYKRGVQLQKSLLPNADVHRRGQIQELRKLVSDLKGMAEELKLEPEDSEEHRRLGQKGIFPAKPTRTETKPLKPKLNTDDLFEL